MTRLLGLGAGGHAKVVLEVALALGYDVVGLLDPRRDLWGTTVCGVPVLGGDELMAPQYDGGVRTAFIGLGSGQDTAPRAALYRRARDAGFEIPSLVHAAAVVSPSATLGRGATVLAGGLINADAVLGENVIVNTGAIVEHDCRLGDHVHVASGARLAGGVQIGDGVHVGLGACVNQGIEIGPGAVVGSGAVVVRDVEPGAVVAGVPARPLRGTVTR